ncbi:putative zinc finger protein [Rutstroemia sp. NJR-2017a BBW]|nr:putative zinc finger protein [Rutstroemia sp. NJR-2017a BBW]
MASEQVAIPATAPLFTATLSDPVTTPSTVNLDHPEPEPTRTKSLKRSRPEQSQVPENLTSIANAGLGVSPAKSPRFDGALSPGFAAIPLTGTAAFEDERRKRQETEKNQAGAMSENPGHKALTSLLAGGGIGMSKPQDAPVATTAMSEGMSAAANAITIPTPMQFDDKPETSPASVTSLASLGSTAQTATANSTSVASPAALTSAIEAENRDSRSTTNQLRAADEQSGNKAMSFPGNLAQVDPSQYPPREKPYVCQSCSMRFRRLHDLKRHMKLHTGERPHICPKCDRKFARGDALARHSKGLGGCAGRRASMGSFGGEEDFDGANTGEGDDTGMDGIMYTNGTPHPNDSEISEEDHRRFSLPSIKAPHSAGNSGAQDSYTSHSRTPSTYPPAGPRPNPTTGSLYPPGAERGGSSSTATSPSMQNNVIGTNNSMSLGNNGGSMYSQSGITESPKPLSPSAMHSHQLGHDSSAIGRQRSPSLTTQFQQQHFGRHQSGRASPPGMSLPSPHSTQGPKLPALTGLAPPDTRFTLGSQITNQHSPGGGQSQQLSATSPTSLFQAGNPAPNRGPPSQQGSGDSSNLFASGERVWVYVQSLEDKVKQLSEKVHAMESKEKSQEEKIKAQEEKINRLSEEVLSLSNQLTSQKQSQETTQS